MKKKKHKPTPEEQLGLTGNESVHDLYNLYIRMSTSGNKLVDLARATWVKAYRASK